MASYSLAEMSRWNAQTLVSPKTSRFGGAAAGVVRDRLPLSDSRQARNNVAQASIRRVMVAAPRQTPGARGATVRTRGPGGFLCLQGCDRPACVARVGQ